MSLKGFHIVFVTITTLLCIFLALWSFVFDSEESTMMTVLGVVGLFGTLVMPGYGIYFYRKLTRIHI
jgi:DNA-binding transcriptional regulator of glucitol operon